MKWPKFIIAAIVLHLLVLFGFTWTMVRHVQEKEHYVEVTLEAPPQPPPTPPAPRPPPETIDLGLARGNKSEENPAPNAGTQADKPASPPEAMAVVPTPETPNIPDDDMTRQAADKAGPDTPGVIGGHGGGGGDRYKVIAMPGGITWVDAELAALAWGRQLAYLHSGKEEQEVFKLADDLQYWRDTANATLGPWLGGDFRFKPRLDPAFGAQDLNHGVFNHYGPEELIKLNDEDNWGILFEGPGPNQRKPKPVETNYSNPKAGVLNRVGEAANGFVVEYMPVTLRAHDVSLAKGHFGNHTFEVFAAPYPGISWFDAEKQAHARGGYLAIVPTAEENNFVYQLTIQKPGAWRSSEPRMMELKDKSEPRHMLRVDLGPWLGGCKMYDQFSMPGEGNPYMWDPSPNEPGWRWFHFVTSTTETGLPTTDVIPYLNWAKNDLVKNVVIAALGDGMAINFVSHMTAQPVMALHYAKFSDQSVGTWDKMHAHLVNLGYVVEYDDPPAAK